MGFQNTYTVPFNSDCNTTMHQVVIKSKGILNQVLKIDTLFLFLFFLLVWVFFLKKKHLIDLM